MKNVQVQKSDLTNYLLKGLEEFKDDLGMSKQEYAALKLFLVINHDSGKSKTITFDEFMEYSKESHDHLQTFVNRFENEGLANKQRFFLGSLARMFEQMRIYKSEKAQGSFTLEINYSEDDYTKTYAIQDSYWGLEVTDLNDGMGLMEVLLKEINTDGLTGGKNAVYINLDDLKKVSTLFSEIIKDLEN
ncbi:hypothetical protein WKH56_33070 [Priestia sp. SB1]